jgi:maltooligosyltrehalose trehalohydrolase
MGGRFAHRLPWGAEIVEGGARFRLWAPAQNAVELVVADTDHSLAMRDAGEGGFEVTTDAVKIDRGYGFALADGSFVPDPSSRAQMGDVHGFSRLTEAYEWKTPDWKGRPWKEAVLYELHTAPSRKTDASMASPTISTDSPT